MTRSPISLVKKMRLKNQAKYTGSGLVQVMSWPKFDHINSDPCTAELIKEYRTPEILGILHYNRYLGEVSIQSGANMVPVHQSILVWF